MLQLNLTKKGTSTHMAAVNDHTVQKFDKAFAEYYKRQNNDSYYVIDDKLGRIGRFVQFCV